MRETKGITLVALVVTIVVLMILATISINVIFGEEGILDRSEEAKEAQREADAKEKLQRKMRKTCLGKMRGFMQNV